MQCWKRLSFYTSLAASSAGMALAGSFTNNFDAGVPAGAILYGNAVAEDGVIKITKAVNSQAGSIILDDLDAGAPIYGFDMNFRARIGGGSVTPADGWSVNFAPDLPDGTFGEEGVGTGITIAFDIYDNGGGEAPSIDVKVGGTTVAQHKLTIPEILTSGTNFENVHIELKPDGLLNLAYRGTTIYTNLVLPGYQPIAGRFGIGGRTGGLNANQWIDDLSITTALQPQSAITLQPLSITALSGSDAEFSVQITNPDGVTFQWLKNGAPITGATASTLIVPDVTTADVGAKYSVRVTGPNNTVTSDEATLSVADIPGPLTPKISLNFDDGTVPAGSAVFGTAFVDTVGGVNDSGTLKLTINENSQAGAFAIDDVEAGAPIHGFTAQFDLRIGGGSDVPADGFSFTLTPPVADPTVGSEEGYGTGLTVSFDIYDNGGGEAPAIDILYNGKVIASKKLPISVLNTGDNFASVLIRLQSDGTMDVAYKGVLIHDNVFVGGFSSIAGGQYILAARTGGLNANQWVDNLKISNDLTPGPLRITTQPVDTKSLVGHPVTFTGGVNVPTGATFQWLKNGLPITGATSATYNIPAPAATDTGASYQLQATAGGVTVTSTAANLTVVNLAAPSTPTLSLDFNDSAVPASTAVYGNAFVDASGGVNDSGVLKLTVNENSQNGGFVIQPLLGGAEVGTMVAAFDLRLGGGSGNPADGASFNWAPDLLEATVGEAENGSGNGLTIGFDIYDNGGGEAPSVDVKWKGALVAQTKLSKADIQTGDTFRKVLVQVRQDGTLDLAYGDTVLQNGLVIPGYTPLANGKFGFYARTGGENENQWVDNIQILVTKSTTPLRFTQQPSALTALAGGTATFTAALSDPNGATYQWYRNGTQITGATSASFITPALTSGDTGAKYKVVATGPAGTVTSDEATLTVIDPIVVTNPNVSFDFEDGAQPENTFIAGGTYFDAGVVKLTDAVNDSQGTFIIGDPNGGTPVSAFSASFMLHLDNGSDVPADGLSFVWGSDVDPNAGFGEDGNGTGLIVSFDIYDNGGGEAPAIDVIYGGAVVASHKMPIAAMESGAGFIPVVIRVESDGTLDLQYNGQVIYNNLQIPGYKPISGGYFGFGARTGGLNEEQFLDDVKLSTSTAAAAPTITFTRGNDGVLTLNWTGGGTLQARDAFSTGSTWQPVTGATSPYPVTNDRPARFFRIAQ